MLRNKNLSNCCRHKYDRSISRLFWIEFLAGFLYLAQLCTVGLRNTDTCIPNVACLRKKAYLLLVGLSTKPKLILPYSMYCQSVLHTYMPAKTKSVHTVSLLINIRKSYFILFGKPINSKRKPFLHKRSSNLM